MSPATNVAVARPGAERLTKVVEAPTTRPGRRFGLRARTGFEVAVSIGVLMLVLGGWELASRLEWISPVMLPPATEVASATGTLLTADWFYPHLWITVKETVCGFLLALVIAFSLALAMHFSQLARHVLYPYVIVWKLIPAVVLAPVFVLWFGFGIASKMLVAASIAFFVMVVSTLSGFDSVDDESRLLMRSLGASRWKTFRMVTFRTSLPYVFAGMKTGITLAVIGALVAEFINAKQGLGYLLVQFGYTFDQDQLFAAIVVVAMLGLVCFGVITFIERRVVWWRG